MNNKFFIFVFVLLMVPAVYADLRLDSIQFDPAIIASGDEVDIIIQFHDVPSGNSQGWVGDVNYNFKVGIESDDTLTKDYVIIQDSEGDNLNGKIYVGGYYNKLFRVKVKDNAPAGNYQFKLTGTWYKGNISVGGIESVKFMMPVKKEGIVLSVSNIISDPEKVRSGDKDILMHAEIFNSGEKSAKNVKIKFSYPKGISSSYTNNNEITLGVIESMQKKNLQFYLDTDKYLKSGVHYINYTLNYQDLDSNTYTFTSLFPFVVKKKPNIIVLNSSGSALAGDTAELRVTVKNVGEEKADAVDVRIIKQSSQPFEMDVRSSYLGQIAPGESAVAVFSLSVNRDAEIKEHSLNIAIRAKGDMEEGDSNIYSYTGKATINVEGKQKNNYPLYAGIFLAVVIIASVIYYSLKKKSSKKK